MNVQLEDEKLKIKTNFRVLLAVDYSLPLRARGKTILLIKILINFKSVFHKQNTAQLNMNTVPYFKS